MPPEWHSHASTWLAWPKNRITWPASIAEVQETYLDLIVTLGSSERVDLLVDTRETGDQVRRRLSQFRRFSGSVRFHRIRTADCWIRDFGPNFLLRPLGNTVDLALNHWGFNAWGNRYPDLARDAEVPRKVACRLGIRRFSPRLTLEGGAIDVNGEGDCLASEPCLLNPNRNPGKSRSEVERKLKDHLGIQRVIWLGEGVAGDDTDAHVDQIARFVAPGTIACSQEQDPTDPNFHPLNDNWLRLRMARNARGCPFELVSLPMPAPLESAEGRVPASYANFYIANGLVVFPAFGAPQDSPAREILEGLFPNRRVVGIDCRKMVLGKGALHCITQQQPA